MYTFFFVNYIFDNIFIHVFIYILCIWCRLFYFEYKNFCKKEKSKKIKLSQIPLVSKLVNTFN